MNLSFALKLLPSTNMRAYTIITLAVLAITITLPAAVVFSMGGSIVSFLNSSISIEQAEMKGFYMGGSVPGNTYAWGNCTYWVFAMRLWAKDPIPTTWGNANTWDDRALSDDYEVNNTPRIGSIMQTDAGEFGHVAYVTWVNVETGAWTISEMNAVFLNVVSRRDFTAEMAASYVFIHGKIPQSQH